MSALSSTPGSSNTQDANSKISGDLVVLTEKMDLLESMLNPSDASMPKASVHSEAMQAIIGYLDACGPRMIELVTVCTSSHFGVLGESVFGNLLEANDRLQKLLSEVDTRMLVETPASTTVAAAAVSTSDDLTEQFGDLLLGNEDPFAQAHGAAAAAAPKTTGEDDGDDYGEDDFKPSATAQVEGETDPFDDFFAERTTTNTDDANF